MSVPSTSVNITASAAAIARLAKALVTWKQEESTFIYHMMTLPEGKDGAYWGAVNVLHTIAHAHSEGETNRIWQDLEIGVSKEKIRAHVECVIANATVV